ncbi:hypothetical protein UFOVP1482_17 [uncultured Caudovirales phage]|uniref:Glycine-rich domain-containing protein n=1 Tax=uncultured Caudovirales phage TaxID=2100421 RepID=A0A6J5QL15_9CAUD|nr:hypothetical protein UFOVP1121_18 [uncultured Caudovirales phage]CAB4215320.1 hypothetical protein UFOVP1482_17 [uncultured Caudovirales phage]
MVAFTAGSVLTAANLNSAFNALTIRTVTGTSDTLVLADAGGCVTYSNASATTSTIPPFSSIAYATGTKIVLVNLGAGVVTVTAGAGVTVNGATLTLAQNAGGTCIKTATNTWSFLPFSSGVGAANFSDTATGSYSGFKYLTFSASGTITVTTAGFADLIVVGGGGGGSNANGGGGGAGGALVITGAYLPAGTLTVTIGAGGAAGLTNGISGNPTRIGSYYSPQGGGGAQANDAGQNGASGGGGKNGGAGGAGTSGIGSAGGLSPGTAGVAGSGGGGGATAVGAAGTSAVGGIGGAGTSTTIAGTTPTGAYVAGSYTFSGGGGGGSVGGTAGTATDGGGAGSASTTGTNGTANKGGGGGGGGGGTALGGNGGSGLVIVRVAV